MRKIDKQVNGFCAWEGNPFKMTQRNSNEFHDHFPLIWCAVRVVNIDTLETAWYDRVAVETVAFVP